ncbi:MAG: PEGA domain-containing protein [Candidatus Methanoperedens sp.]|nr:PEGA domain-containing protein [Candidatus Methanoperedens sp.]
MKIVSCILIIVLVLAFLPVTVLGDTVSRVVPTATQSSTIAAPATGVLYLDSYPTGAFVLIDGTSQGSTPLILRTINAGDHRILMKKDGYADYSTTITIHAGGELREVYTLIPITTPAATTPAPTVVFPAITTPTNYIAPTSPTPTPMQVLPTTPPGIAATSTPMVIVPQTQKVKTNITGYHRLVINAGSVNMVTVLDAASPYYSSQFGANLINMPLTIIEVDYNNHAKYGHDQPGGSGFYQEPNSQVWVDQNTVTIDKTAKTYDVNFRYMTGDKWVTGMLWQISRYPFANDPDHWQNKYIPGIVASGQVKEYHNDSEDYHYFVINFAKVAGKNPGDPPYFEGTASINTNTQGMGEVQDVSKLLFMDTGFVMKKINMGFISFQAPVSLMTMPAGEFTQAELGNPNDKQVLISADFLQFRSSTPLESMMLDMDRKYYVRIVPIHDGGKAGIPSIPVEVIVNRSNPTSSLSGNITVKPPSARILWYMQPNLNIYQSDYVSFGTDASYHWYYAKSDTYHPEGLHTYEPPVPEDKSWWEKTVDFFGSIINYFSDVMTGMAEAWNALQDIYVDLAAKVLSYTITGGLYRCDEHPDCTGVLKTGMQAVMAAYGIPPTLPTGPELTGLSTDYLVELGADQLGAGEVYDAYQSMPDEVKQQMKSGAHDISQKTVNAQKSAMDDAAQQAYCKNYSNPGYAFDKSQSPTITFCNYKVPDPIYNSVHPATAMIYVNNPNSQPSDRIILEVKDSMGLFYGTAVIPKLESGKSISVPVILTEDYNQFKKVNGGPCSPDEASISYQGGSLVQPPCPVAEWVNKWKQGGKYWKGTMEEDMFAISFKGQFGMSLNDQSSGKKVPNSFYNILYPQGWQITTQGKSIVPDTWDPDMFAGGMLRNKP